MFEQGISRQTRQALAPLGKLPDIKQFYLAGGTACALRIGHRLSYDLDFFTENSFSAKKLSSVLASVDKFTEEQALSDTLLGEFIGIKVSFFQYRYPLISSTEKFEKVKIVGLPDLAAMKIDAISDRGSKRDFVDLFFIEKTYGLETILKFYDDKYELLEANQFHIIKSLAYFADAESEEMPEMLKEISWEEVKKFFEKEAIRLGKKYLS